MLLFSVHYLLFNINVRECFSSIVLVRNLSTDFAVLQMGPFKRQLSGGFSCFFVCLCFNPSSQSNPFWFYSRMFLIVSIPKFMRSSLPEISLSRKGRLVNLGETIIQKENWPLGKQTGKCIQRKCCSRCQSAGGQLEAPRKFCFFSLLPKIALDPHNGDWKPILLLIYLLYRFGPSLFLEASLSSHLLRHLQGPGHGKSHHFGDIPALSHLLVWAGSPLFVW